MSLTGRRALVTGVSRRAGIGYAIARRLIDAGASVFVQGWTKHDASWITGQTINSEGGFRRWG